jgi:hypothetical protein
VGQKDRNQLKEAETKAIDNEKKKSVRGAGEDREIKTAGVLVCVCGGGGEGKIMRGESMK